MTRIFNAEGSEEGVHNLLKSDLGAELPLHISLSRPIVLLTDQRQPFLDALTTAVKTCGVSS